MNQVTISNIAGYDDEKRDASLLAQILKNYTTYQKKGIFLPKGVLFTGLPGAGKTLFAKAIAGEAGASLVEYRKSEADDQDVAPYFKKLFEEAESKAPCVLLLDDMDSILSEDKIGPSRKETITQVLTEELDHLQPSNGVLVVATASERRALPSALTRNGRIDHQIYLASPEMADRKAILKAYLGPLCCEADVDVLADHVVGFGPAEMKCFVTEATLNAEADGRGTLLMQDFDKAMVRVNWGENFRGPKANCANVCYHELGHFLVDRALNHYHNCASVYRSSQYRGFIMGDKEEDCTWAKNTENAIATSLAGIAAQRIFCHDIDFGGGSDIDSARAKAEKLVDYGYCGIGRAIDGQGSKRRDRMVRRLVKRGYRKATWILRKPSNRKLVRYLAPILVQKQYLSSAELESLIADYSSNKSRETNTEAKK